MKIYIPSLKRYNVIMQRGTIAKLPRPLHDRVTLIVAEHEKKQYEDALRNLNIEVRSTPAQGIAATRLEIGKLAADRGEGKFLMMDDDLYEFQVRKGEEVWNLRLISTVDEVTEMLAYVESLLDEHAHVGISPREGNAHAGVGHRDALTKTNTRTLRALAYQTDAFLAVEHGRVAVMEDFDVNLQLLERGLSNASIHWWAQGQQKTNAPGGCSTYRTHQVQDESATKLAELHPGLVRLRQKSNKTDREGFGTRTEVTIAWKKAFERGIGAR